MTTNKAWCGECARCLYSCEGHLAMNRRFHPFSLNRINRFACFRQHSWWHWPSQKGCRRRYHLFVALYDINTIHRSLEARSTAYLYHGLKANCVCGASQCNLDTGLFREVGILECLSVLHAISMPVTGPVTGPLPGNVMRCRATSWIDLPPDRTDTACNKSSQNQLSEKLRKYDIDKK